MEVIDLLSVIETPLSKDILIYSPEATISHSPIEGPIYPLRIAMPQIIKCWLGAIIPTNLPEIPQKTSADF